MQIKKKKTLDTNSNIPFKQIKRSKHLGPYLAGLIEGEQLLCMTQYPLQPNIDP